jgi:hypothetical protein
MTPALLVELRPEAVRQPRRPLLLRQIAPRAGHAGAAAGAGILAFPWSIGMIFTHPAAIFAKLAFHDSESASIGSRSRFFENSILADLDLGSALVLWETLEIFRGPSSWLPIVPW